MKLRDLEAYTAAEDLDPSEMDPLEYKPVVPKFLISDKGEWLGFKPDADHLHMTNSIQQWTLRHYDALHYWFMEGDKDSEELSAPHGVTRQLANSFALAVKERDQITLLKNQQPDWKMVRDNAVFVSGAALGDRDVFVQKFIECLDEGVVQLDASRYDYDREKGADETSFEKLIGLDNASKGLIEDVICGVFSAREALDYLAAYQTQVVHIPYMLGGAEAVSMRKWFFESKILTEHAINRIPEFRCNFHTLVIHGATKHIHTGKLNLNRLYRVLAIMGRINTRLVFID